MSEEDVRHSCAPATAPMSTKASATATAFHPCPINAVGIRFSPFVRFFFSAKLVHPRPKANGASPHANKKPAQAGFLLTHGAADQGAGAASPSSVASGAVSTSPAASGSAWPSLAAS